MHQRRPARVLTRRQLLTAGGAVLAPVALLAWWQPWRSLTTSSSLVPTPPPPTATRIPERIAFPTERPRPSAPSLPSVTPAAIATAPPRTVAPATTPTALNAASAAGTLLYLGTIEGRRGVIATTAAGDNRRILVPGSYDHLAVSPDGARLAVVGAIPDSGGLNQLTILDDNNRARARYEIGVRLNGRPAWSPNSASLLCSISANDATAITPRWETWVFGEDGARQITLPSPTGHLPQGWTPDGRIATVTSEDPEQPRESTLWTLDAAGGNPRRLFAGAFSPVGWSREGGLLYALAYDNPRDYNAPLSQLIEIDRATSDTRFLANASALAVNALGLAGDPTAYRFDFAYPSPDGMQFALGVAPLQTPSTRLAPAELRAKSVIFMRRNRQITGIAPLNPGTTRGPAAWSPDGTRFALLISAPTDGNAQLFVADTTGASLSDLQVDRAYLGLPPHLAWSRDSQWLGYTAFRGVSVTTFGPTRGTFLGPGSTYPAWRPFLQA